MLTYEWWTMPSSWRSASTICRPVSPRSARRSFSLNFAAVSGGNTSSSVFPYSCSLVTRTKAQQQTTHPNVQRKRRAAATWCGRINALPPYDRAGREWHYALVGESLFEDWRRNNARMADLLAFCRIRPATSQGDQGTLAV